MHVNANVSPYAISRRCKAKFILYTSSTATGIEYPFNKIISATLTQECYMEQTAKPHCEMSVTVDNRDGTFDITSPTNVYYSLNRKSYADFYLSTVASSNTDEYIRKCRYQYDSISLSGNNVTIKLHDVFSDTALAEEWMDTACEYTNCHCRELINYVTNKVNLQATCTISDTLNNLRTFEFNTGVDAITAMYRMQATFTSATKSTIRLMIDDEGNIKYMPKKTVADETLSSDKYKDFQIQTPQVKKGSLIGVLSDRGNILRELADVLTVSDNGKSYTMEIYYIQYNLNGGTLSAVNKGVII